MKYTTRRRRHAQLMTLDHKQAMSFSSLDCLGDSLAPGDVIVVNDAATVPASVHMLHRRTAQRIEVRLVSYLGKSMTEPRSWRAITLGAGDWQTPTEKRPSFLPEQGDILDFGDGFQAMVEAVNAPFVDLEFQESSVWRKLFAAGKPIQYYYHQEAFELWDAQTIFASHPVAVEPPSASMHLQWSQVLRLRERGIQVVSLTHAAGISTLGNLEADRLLPLPERYAISEETAATVNRAHARGALVVAFGTSVVRALESAADERGHVLAGEGIATLKLSRSYRRKAVDALLTGMHDEDASHLQLLAAFVEPQQLKATYRAARARGFLWHEFGDLTLLKNPLARVSRWSA